MWEPNGCLDDSLSAKIGEISLSFVPPLPFPIPGTFTWDAPGTDVNFLDVCNGHDKCWGFGRGFEGCNTAFEADLMTACSSSGNPLCSVYGSAYATAVKKKALLVPRSTQISQATRNARLGSSTWSRTHANEEDTRLCVLLFS